jgi:hypothetical protein
MFLEEGEQVWLIFPSSQKDERSEGLEEVELLKTALMNYTQIKGSTMGGVPLRVK